MNDKATSTKIIVFCCYQSAYEAADMAGTMRLSLPENLNIVRVPCTGKVDVIHILKKERLEIYNLAPNMGPKFAEITSSMAENLKKLSSTEK